MQRSRSVLLALVLLLAQWFVAFSDLAHVDLQCDAECVQSLATLDGQLPLLPTWPIWQAGEFRIESPSSSPLLREVERPGLVPRARAPPLLNFDSRDA